MPASLCNDVEKRWSCVVAIVLYFGPNYEWKQNGTWTVVTTK